MVALNVERPKRFRAMLIDPRIIDEIITGDGVEFIILKGEPTHDVFGEPLHDHDVERETG